MPHPFVLRIAKQCSYGGKSQPRAGRVPIGLSAGSAFPSACGSAGRLKPQIFSVEHPAGSGIHCSTADFKQFSQSFNHKELYLSIMLQTSGLRWKCLSLCLIGLHLQFAFMGDWVDRNVYPFCRSNCCLLGYVHKKQSWAGREGEGPAEQKECSFLQYR